MSNDIDVQAEIIGQLQQRLAAVPEFGDVVREGHVQTILDAEGDAEAEQLIVLQDGDTVEQERTPGGVKEAWTINVVAMSRRRGAGPALRTARLEIKRALRGLKAGVDVPGLIQVSFPPSAGQMPAPGRRWGFRVIPITFTYHQKL
ncbi:hypothetical protein [Pseudomonas knackmussii]|uniref:hypothetical protein n=1 Tax=Pseudomonas knackmussii TaxID=65741 RepID=UPI001363615F|nr:hypothetical protein [Pseudomonas knackmussii]